MSQLERTTLSDLRLLTACILRYDVAKTRLQNTVLQQWHMTRF
jgi:hypothetical protein